MTFLYSADAAGWVLPRPAEALVCTTLARAALNKNLRFMAMSARAAELFASTGAGSMTTAEGYAAILAAATAAQ